MQSNLNLIKKLITVSTKPNNIWFITAPQYPPFFLMRWFWYLQNQHNVSYEFIEDTQILGCSFLGAGKYYWLGCLGDYAPKKKQEVLNYLLNYQGPHSVGIFIDNETAQKIYKNNLNLIDLNLADLQSFAAALPWFTTEKQQYLKKVSSIDQAVLWQEYSYLVKEQITNLIEEWPVQQTDESFFNLAKYFFKKDSKNFLNLFHKLQDSYTTQFYISYFADQLFRAIFYCHYRQHGMLEQAKTVSYKLPYHLLQNEWQNLDIKHLQLKLIELYEIDFQIKNGGSTYLLDSWFLTYLNKN
jgi:hypothetical protein